mmetsp:Transcript_7453/g.7641  ORF Transcript_7453/g.7641 Transcript_7453/m.7641 type:complete len:84 (-) Transcript_7453:122-373(-)
MGMHHGGAFATADARAEGTHEECTAEARHAALGEWGFATRGDFGDGLGRGGGIPSDVGGITSDWQDCSKDATGLICIHSNTGG